MQHQLDLFWLLTIAASAFIYFTSDNKYKTICNSM